MKVFLYLLGVVGAGIIGYVAEPSLRYQLTGIHPGSSDPADPMIVQVDEHGNVTRFRIDIASLRPDQFPERVRLKKPLQVLDSATGATMRIEANSTVKPLRIENRQLVVGPGTGNFEGIVAVTDTDLLQQITGGPLPEKPPARDLPPVAMNDPMQGMMDSPGQDSGDLMDQMDDAGDQMPESDPEPEEDADAEPEEDGDTGPVDVVETMQESIKSGQITTFTFDQVTDWKEQENETIDDREYQVGIATYQAETFLGVQAIQAKALIRGGKVQRWVMAQSGFEIK